MQQHLTGVRFGLGLETNAQPSVVLARAGTVAGGDGVGKDKKPGGLGASRAQPVAGAYTPGRAWRQAGPSAHSTLRRAVNLIADVLDVDANGFRDSARCSANAEEPARGLLARARFLPACNKQKH